MNVFKISLKDFVSFLSFFELYQSPIASEQNQGIQKGNVLSFVRVQQPQPNKTKGHIGKSQDIAEINFAALLSNCLAYQCKCATGFILLAGKQVGKSYFININTRRLVHPFVHTIPAVSGISTGKNKLPPPVIYL